MKTSGGGFAIYLRRYWALYLMLLLPTAYFLIFKYLPIVNILLAFKQNNIIKGIFEIPWARDHGFEWFIKAFKNRDFLYALRNTLMLNALDIIAGFPAPIIFALLLNELAFRRYKKLVQTVAYMPHFLSWIIISGLALQLFAPSTGLVNMAVMKMGGTAIPFLNESTHWVVTYILIGVWQSVGWNTIIYLAAITAIDPGLYEAAEVDGAGRFRKIWNITLPGIRPTITILLIMRMGQILGSDFDRPFALTNAFVKDVSNVISTFVYTTGIKGMQYSLTTAVGLFQSVICVIFLLAADRLSRKFGERGLW